jgi:hypothetical protein
MAWSSVSLIFAVLLLLGLKVDLILVITPSESLAGKFAGTAKKQIPRSIATAMRNVREQLMLAFPLLLEINTSSSFYRGVD